MEEDFFCLRNRYSNHDPSLSATTVIQDKPDAAGGGPPSLTRGYGRANDVGKESSLVVMRHQLRSGLNGVKMLESHN